MLWENHARVLVDFSPGSGMMARTALAMGVKVVLVCLNDAHMQYLKKSLVSYIRAAIEGNNTAFCPADKQERLDQLQPARLKVWHEQKGQKADPQSQGAGRQKFQAGMDAVLDALQSGTQIRVKDVGPAPKKPRVEPPKNSDTKPKAEPPKKEETAAPSAAATPTESVADLLKKWA